MLHQFVGSGSQGRMSGGRPKERAVHVALEVLDAHAHGEGLALELDVCVAKKLKDVACRVSACKNHIGCPYGLFASALLQSHATYLSPAEFPTREPCAKANLSTQLLDASRDAGDDAGKHVTAHVGLCVPEDAALRACFRQ